MITRTGYTSMQLHMINKRLAWFMARVYQEAELDEYRYMTEEVLTA